MVFLEISMDLEHVKIRVPGVIVGDDNDGMFVEEERGFCPSPAVGFLGIGEQGFVGVIDEELDSGDTGMGI